jgi:hypothetical protein
MELEMLMGPSVALPFGDVAAPSNVGSQRQLQVEFEVERQLAIHGRGADMANRIVLVQETIDLAGYIPEELIPRGETNSGIPKARSFWRTSSSPCRQGHDHPDAYDGSSERQILVACSTGRSTK